MLTRDDKYDQALLEMEQARKLSLCTLGSAAASSSNQGSLGDWPITELQVRR